MEELINKIKLIESTGRISVQDILTAIKNYYNK